MKTPVNEGFLFPGRASTCALMGGGDSCLPKQAEPMSPSVHHFLLSKVISKRRLCILMDCDEHRSLPVLEE